jgi:hypothetical protein
MAIAGLLSGAFGIGLLWASGRIAWPIYPPPGIVNLSIGAVVVAFCRRWWAPMVASVMGALLLGGFLLSGGPPNLIGRQGPSVALGNWIMIVSGLTAILAGALATRNEHRTPEPH